MKAPAYLPTATVDDTQLSAVATRFGCYCLACSIESLDPDLPHSSTDFSASNPYAHFAVRHGDVTAVRATPTDEQLKRAQLDRTTPVGDVKYKGQ